MLFLTMNPLSNMLTKPINPQYPPKNTFKVSNSLLKWNGKRSILPNKLNKMFRKQIHSFQAKRDQPIDFLP